VKHTRNQLRASKHKPLISMGYADPGSILVALCVFQNVKKVLQYSLKHDIWVN
jgi:hypothetical protein